MSSIFIDLAHNKGTFEIKPSSERQYLIIKDFLKIIDEYDLDINKQDLENIIDMSRL